MNKLLLLIACITFLNCYNKEQKNEIVENRTKIIPIDNSFDLISNKSVVKSNEILSVADFTEIKLPLSLIFFKESERTFLNVDDRFFKVNWHYSIENESISSSNILIFKNNLEYIILIPTFSEEFPTFQMVAVNKNREFVDYGVHTYSTSDFKQIGNTSFDKIKYQIIKKNDILRINAVDGNKNILLSDISENKGAETQISTFEKTEVKTLRNENLKKKSQVVSLDLNLDGKKENFEVSFDKSTVNSSKNRISELFFNKDNLIIQKTLENNNPHDFLSYKYYFRESNESIILDKIDFRKETYVENDDLCNLDFIYLPHKTIHFSEVDFFDQFFLESLVRNLTLDQATEIVTKTNQLYKCTSNLSINEIDLLLNTTVLNYKTVNQYNNLGYNLQQKKQYQVANHLLSKIVKKYPNRIVSWLNLGDTLWELNEKEQAKSAYQKYINLMNSDRKELSKIPKKVYERIK